MLRSLKCLFLLGFLLVGCFKGYLTKANAIKDPIHISPVTTARRLVHEANWASVGTISSNSNMPGYPMVNVISIDDSDADSKSTGKIHFLLMDLDYTGQDWRALNKITFLISDEQNKNCEKRNIDPMEHTCARIIISGKVVEMDKKADGFEKILDAFVKRHPAAKKWLKAHIFYMCELNIESITLMDSYGGYKAIIPEEYYEAHLE